MNEKDKEELIKAYEKRKREQTKWTCFSVFLAVIIGMPLLFGYLQGNCPDWANEPWIIDPHGRGLTSPLGLTCFLAWIASAVGFGITASIIGDEWK